MKLTNSQFDEIMSIYYKRQFQCQNTERMRLDEIHRQIPEYRALEQQISELSLQHAQAKLQRGQNTGDLEQQIREISKQKEDLLTSHGYSADYLQPVYVCPDCQDTGYIGTAKCHCLEKEIVTYLYSQSNLQQILEKENFAHFSLDFYSDDYTEESTGLTPRENMKNILNTARDFVKNFDTQSDNLLLYGNTGVGKTFLANCIAKELLDQSHTVVYLTSLKLFDILEAYKFDRDMPFDEKNATVAYILDSDLLIIDDLGTELNNGFTSSQLYHCIDTRLNHRHSTIISTNLSFDDLRDDYSERIFSRLTSNYTLLKLTGDDIRLKKAIMQRNLNS